jgi:hypothetical protein
LIQASGIASVVLITGSAGTWLDNFEIDGASLTGIDGTNSFALVSNLKVHHCAIGISSSTGSAVLCESYSCTTAGNYATNKSFCVSYSNSGHGFQGNASGVAIRCASWSNTFSGFINTLLYVECTSHGNGHSGFGTNTSVRTTAINCVSTGNTQYGFDSGSTTADLMNLVSCASRSNTSGRFRGLSSVDISSVTLSGDPYANVAGLGSATTLQAMLQCLSPNNTAGAGALLRAAGIVPYSDIGAVQHQDSGGSGATPRFGLAGAGPSFRGVGV